MNGTSVLEDRCVVGVVECVHDVCVVRALEEPGRATVDEYPTFFVNSVQSVKFANYQSLPDEDFAGERCFGIRSIPREEQFWISQESGDLLGCLTFINQGQFTPSHEMEALRQMAGQKFENRDAAQQWMQEVASNEQRQQLWADWNYLHRDIQHPQHLTVFQDYREVAPGIELPHTEWQSGWSHKGDIMKAVHVLEIVEFKWVFLVR